MPTSSGGSCVFPAHRTPAVTVNGSGVVIMTGTVSGTGRSESVSPHGTPRRARAQEEPAPTRHPTVPGEQLDTQSGGPDPPYNGSAETDVPQLPHPLAAHCDRFRTRSVPPSSAHSALQHCHRPSSSPGPRESPCAVPKPQCWATTTLLSAAVVLCVVKPSSLVPKPL